MLVIVPCEKGNNRFSVRRSFCIGTYPDKKSAEGRRKEIHAEFNGSRLTSESERQALGRGVWDVRQELLVRPSFLMKEDGRQVRTGNITSKKNCECPYRC